MNNFIESFNNFDDDEFYSVNGFRDEYAIIDERERACHRQDHRDLDNIMRIMTNNRRRHCYERCEREFQRCRRSCF